MGDKKFLLVVYDITNDRRRTRVHNALLDFGTPVQYSVFECWVDEQEEMRLKRIVRRLTKPRADSVRYYRLCASCVANIEVLGPPDVTGEPPPALVVG